MGLTIPHKLTEEGLKLKHGIKIISLISFLRVGNLESEYSGILSFRHEIHISSDETRKHSNSITIIDAETLCRIFIAEENIACYICKKKNCHNAIQCPSFNTINLPENETSIPKQNISPVDASSQRTELTPRNPDENSKKSTHKNLKQYTSTFTIPDRESDTTTQLNKHVAN